MASTDLLFVCLSAFAAVFVLLGGLALVMRALIAVFPAPAASAIEPAMVAAITAAATAAHPDSAVTKIEELS